MFNLQLFLGISLEGAFQDKLQTANPYLRSLFIGKEEYLQEIVHQKKRYLGKYFSSYPTIDQIEDMEKHVVSLLSKLTPDFLFEKNPLVLVTVPSHD